MGTVTPIKRTVLPDRVFQVVEKFMLGEYKSLYIVAVNIKDEVVKVTAGDIPELFSRNDTQRL